MWQSKTGWAVHEPAAVPHLQLPPVSTPPPHLPRQQPKTRIKRSTIWLNSTEILTTRKTTQFVLKGPPRLIWQSTEEETWGARTRWLEETNTGRAATYPQGVQLKSREPGARGGATLQSSYKPVSGPTGRSPCL